MNGRFRDIADCDYFRVRRVENSRGKVTLVVSGELDRFAVQDFNRHLDAVCAMRLGAFVLDASGLSFCDTAGINAILRAQKAFAGQGTKMRIVGLQHSVERVFELSGLSESCELVR